MAARRPSMGVKGEGRKPLEVPFCTGSQMAVTRGSRIPQPYSAKKVFVGLFCRRFPSVKLAHGSLFLAGFSSARASCTTILVRTPCLFVRNVATFSSIFPSSSEEYPVSDLAVRTGGGGTAGLFPVASGLPSCRRGCWPTAVVRIPSTAMPFSTTLAVSPVTLEIMVAVSLKSCRLSLADRCREEGEATSRPRVRSSMARRGSRERSSSEEGPRRRRRWSAAPGGEWRGETSSPRSSSDTVRRRRRSSESGGAGELWSSPAKTSSARLPEAEEESSSRSRLRTRHRSRLRPRSRLRS
mmetsp:Transcript_41235/g.96697  ORF Transcript_41235/g.96697 Transcript_41235/m.96697 type:complete len:297 (+) Transcript_41235:1654-2544(+)